MTREQLGRKARRILRGALIFLYAVLLPGTILWVVIARLRQPIY